MLIGKLIKLFTDIEARATRQKRAVGSTISGCIRNACGIAAMRYGGGGVNRMPNSASEAPILSRVHPNVNAQSAPEGVTLNLSSDQVAYKAASAEAMVLVASADT